MKERGILFTKETRQKSIDGTKTQTRRIAKLPNKWHRGFGAFEHNPNGDEEFVIYGVAGEKKIYAPYRVGDRLYIKEPIFIHCGGMFGGELMEDTQFSYIENPEKKCRTVKVKYDYNISYRPAYWMHKWAARYWFEVTGVRVERVQDITWRDCLAEGIRPVELLGPHTRLGKARQYKIGFRNLWDSINKKRGYSWDKNPWVWVVEFKRIDK